MVIESKSLYNRFVDFAFFVVKNWKAAKDAKSAEGMGKREEVIESKSLYNRFVDFVFFVVKKDWEEGRGTEARCGSAESKTRKQGEKFFDKILIGG